MSVLKTTLVQAGRYGNEVQRHRGGRFLVAIMILLLIALIGVAIWSLVVRTRHAKLATAAGQPGSPTVSASNARSILDERFARGEIDGAEYEERRRLLG
jgi:putative membrane protein